MVLGDDLKRMKRVMRRLGLISKEEIVEMKGKVACEVSACDEIIVNIVLYSSSLNFYFLGYSRELPLMKQQHYYHVLFMMRTMPQINSF